MLRSIVVATDGSDRSGRAVGFAAQMARCFGASLTIVHVQVPGATIPQGVERQAGESGATLDIIESDAPADAICEAADDAGADAIVLGNYGMSDRKEFLLGNVPNRVSHRAQCTVIIVDTRDDKERRKARR